MIPGGLPARSPAYGGAKAGERGGAKEFQLLKYLLYSKIAPL